MGPSFPALRKWCHLFCMGRCWHPVLVEVADEELGGDALEEVVRWQGLLLFLGFVIGFLTGFDWFCLVFVGF